MQSLTWYMKRLFAMSPDEIVWRVRGVARDWTDRHFLASHARRAVGAFDPPPASGPRENRLYCGSSSWMMPAWRDDLLRRADQVITGRLRIFDFETAPTNEGFDWNRDPKHDVAAPLRFAPSIDYRDFREVGDCKFVWEPNRHLQFVVLARAYAASDDERYLRELTLQWSSWLQQCPFGLGMNWRSPLELAIRVINWALAWELTNGGAALPAKLRDEILRSVYLHIWETARKYSRGSSANNHLIGEAAGVYVASVVFPFYREAATWRAQAFALLEREIIKQTFADGFTREQATGYHLFVVEFFTLAAIAAQRIGDPISQQYLQRLQAMHCALAAWREGGDAPMVGDADDGAVTDLASDALDPRPWLGIGAALFSDSTLARAADRQFEAAGWLFGSEALSAMAETDAHSKEPLQPRAFEEAGYYFLQCGVGDRRLSALFDCGPLGYTAIAAHGHADALSFTLRAAGADVFVDPGTYDYFTYPSWREHFRGSRAHNTLTIDGVDQSEMRGPFMWGARAQSRCLEWQPDKLCVFGEHDGYRRLTDPVTHQRRIEIDAGQAALTISDQIVANGAHDAELWFHLAEDCRISGVDEGKVRFSWARGEGTLIAPEGTELTTFCGSEAPIAGWVSSGYHRKTPAPAICCRGTIRGESRWVTRIELRFVPHAREGGVKA